MLFRLLAVADGHTPALTPKLVDPRAGPVTFKLAAHDLDKRDPALVLKGRVLDEDRKPVAGAVVEPWGFQKGQRGQGGGLKGFDHLAVTNNKGEFRLGVPEPGLEVWVQVGARFMAAQKAWLLAGPKAHDLTLVTGASVTGRLLKDGKPLAGVAVGLAQKSRDPFTFVGDFQAATDEMGVFRIPHVLPRVEYFLYGKMDSLRAHGAIAVKEVRTGASGAEVDVGDLAVAPGHKLTGQVVLADDKPVPEGARVLVSREEAWDTQQAVVDKDGHFALEGLPPERYSLSVRVPGYRLSPKNGSYDLLGGFRLLGVVRSDIKSLRVLLEKGEGPDRLPTFDQKRHKEYQRLRDAPLRGAPEEGRAK
nr:peptidase M56 [uncultured bacterium]